MLHRMLFLLTNVGKVRVFLGISLGKVVGMEWQAEGLPPGEEGGLAWGLLFHPDNFPEGNPKENPYIPDIG